ncbi:MAG: hypothetical protein EOO68_35160 [Moraxellaceae bacterium]|nr:MAG: hypothetical protein EOO68_35160 [Moraxellaceae bacterium]
MKFKPWLTLTTSIFCSSVLLSGCGMFGSDNAGKTLADLPAANLPEGKSTVAVVDREKIGASYRKALESAEDPVLRQQIMARIADFEMASSENKQLHG